MGEAAGKLTQFLDIRLARHLPQTGALRAVNPHVEIEQRGKVETCRIVGGDRHDHVGPGLFALRHRDEVGTRCGERQAVIEGRHLGNIGHARAGAGAVEPVVLTADARTGDDVIEIAGNWQDFGQHIALLGADENGLGVDAQTPEQGEQKGGLGLAVAVALGPGVLGLLGDVIPAVEPIEKVADVVLHHLQRHLRAFERIARRRRNAGSLGSNLAIVGNLCRSGEMRGKDARHFLPVRECADPQDRRAAIADRRIGRHVGLLGERKFDRQFAIAILDQRRLDIGDILRTPAHVGILGPAHDDAREADLPGFAIEEIGRLHLVPESLVGRRNRLGDAQDIADLEAGHRQCRGQFSVDQPLFEPLFAADDVEFRATRNHVDRLAVAQDFDAVDGQIPLVGQPAHGERALLRQLVGRVDAHRRIEIGGDHTVFEPPLPVVD